MQKDTRDDIPDQAPTHGDLIALTSEVVTAYVGNNAVATADLPELIGTVYGKLSALGGTPTEPEVEQKPAVPLKRSVTNGAIICLECGKAQKMLKRHLGAAHGLNPEAYRAKWRLSYDYPMVAPDYSNTGERMAMSEYGTECPSRCENVNARNPADARPSS